MTHPNTRLEALCDGVFAIAMTLLILDIRLPSPINITSTAEFWHALWRIAPSVFAFVLSFGVILITWVNHHAVLRLVNNTSVGFIYSNGFLLLAVVAIPFPTGLLGEFLWTGHARPAVVLYNATLAVVALGWIPVAGTALRDHLTFDDVTTQNMGDGARNGYRALGLYALLAVAAVWLPIPAAIATAFSWLFWLVLGIRLKHA
ncbi:MAG TPA: TMEM175 family protein [Chloroflexota bacterium]|jgi:uncharacterized membrane protein